MVDITTTRPKCRRCGGPLDFWHLVEEQEVSWFCNNPQPLRSDEEYFEAIKQLTGDEVVRLGHSCSVVNTKQDNLEM